MTLVDSMKPYLRVILFLIFAIGFVVRLYRFDNPIADWHSWRQADTSSVSRNFLNNGFDLLNPTYHDLSNVPSGMENPQGFRFVEFPIYNFFQAGSYKLFDLFTLEEWGRLVSIFSSLVTSLFLYLFIRKYFGEIQGILTSFFFLFLPFSIYYSRTILPDVMMTMSVLGGIYFFDSWINRSKVKNPKSEINFQFSIFNFQFVPAVLFTSGALLLKPFAIFFVLPMVYLAWRVYGISMLWNPWLWIYAGACLAPLLWWRQWMMQHSEGIPVNSWLFNEGGIRFRPAFFRWMLYERLTKLILGYGGLTIFIFGFIRQKKEDFFLPLTFAISSILYVVVVARGNVQHDYYQIVLLPSIAIFLARGTKYLYDFLKIQKALKLIIIGSLILICFAFSWNMVKDYFNINNWAIVEAGKKADAILPKDAKVIALYNGDTSFLYQTNRSGWPVFTDSIERLVERGAQYIIIANPTQNDFDGFGRQYEIVAKSDKYLILKL